MPKKIVPRNEPEVEGVRTHGLGRPSSYRHAYADQAVKLCRLGATDADLADFFGVVTSTITLWKSQFPKFSAALKLNKELGDDRVERSLYTRAVGYSYNSEKIFCSKDGDVTKVPYVEHVPPDVTACIFWLKNRQPQVWRDRQELTGKDGAALIKVVGGLPA